MALQNAENRVYGGEKQAEIKRIGAYSDAQD
jgi:hypothetical protein